MKDPRCFLSSDMRPFAMDYLPLFEGDKPDQIKNWLSPPQIICNVLIFLIWNMAQIVNAGFWQPQLASNLR